jgi:hypothetical protein
MSYIGNTPTTGHFPTDTFTSVGGSTYTLSQTPANAGAIEVSVQGVLQAVSAYTVDGTTLTLAGVATDDIVFVRHLGETLLIPIPGDDTVTTIKIVDGAVTAAKIDSAVSLGGPSLGTNSVIRTNAKTISENITFAGTENGMTIGPITVANTYSVTVTSGSTWTIV